MQLIKNKIKQLFFDNDDSEYISEYELYILKNDYQLKSFDHLPKKNKLSVLEYIDIEWSAMLYQWSRNLIKVNHIKLIHLNDYFGRYYGEDHTICEMTGDECFSFEIDRYNELIRELVSMYINFGKKFIAHVYSNGKSIEYYFELAKKNILDIADDILLYVDQYIRNIEHTKYKKLDLFFNERIDILLKFLDCIRYENTKLVLNRYSADSRIEELKEDVLYFYNTYVKTGSPKQIFRPPVVYQNNAFFFIKDKDLIQMHTLRKVFKILSSRFLPETSFDDFCAIFSKDQELKYRLNWHGSIESLMCFYKGILIKRVITQTQIHMRVREMFLLNKNRIYDYSTEEYKFYDNLNCDGIRCYKSGKIIIKVLEIFENSRLKKIKKRV